MADSDVLTELREWLEREATTLKHYPADDADTGLVQRAIDEIERLRGRLEVLPNIHDEALEQAVRVIDDISWDWPSPWIDDAESFKAAIRALKGRKTP